jgi:hypothetical protein
MVSTLSAGEGFVGLGASVCLGKAGFGFGGFPANADCAQAGAHTAAKQPTTTNREKNAMSYIMSHIAFTRASSVKPLPGIDSCHSSQYDDSVSDETIISSRFGFGL